MVPQKNRRLKRGGGKEKLNSNEWGEGHWTPEESQRKGYQNRKKESIGAVYRLETRNLLRSHS